MVDATPMPHCHTIATTHHNADLVESVVGFLETTFPSLKSFLSWDDELRELGPIMPELC